MGPSSGNTVVEEAGASPVERQRQQRARAPYAIPAAEQPDAVVFNGYANQYDHRPLPATVGERVRVWVLDAGPNRSSSFHVVGGQFDTIYEEGGYRLRRGDPGGSQVLGLMPAQGGFVELVFPQAGHYSFVSHLMIDAERGAHGIFDVIE
jgi:nitrite reductase (NO-forming)